MADGEILQGDTGTDREALAQGEASKANLAFQAAQPAPGTSEGAGPEVVEEGATGREDPTPPQGVDLSGDEVDDSPGTYSSEEDQFLFGQTYRPDEHVGAYRQGVGQRGSPPPPDVRELIPHLSEAAADPEAPEQIKRLIRLLDYHTRR